MTPSGGARPYDVKRERRDLYGPTSEDFHVVDVPTMSFLMVDGHGDPNTSPTYREAVTALYAVSYRVRALARATVGRVHTVAPLEGLWSARDLTAFRFRDKDAWQWTMLIAQPEWVTPQVAEEAAAATARKATAGKVPAAALDLVRFESLAEGRSVQVLHVGSYDDEGPTLRRLHEEFLPARGLAPRGRHHEIYLSDPRRTDPSRLKTILRQPVRPIG